MIPKQTNKNKQKTILENQLLRKYNRIGKTMDEYIFLGSLKYIELLKAKIMKVYNVVFNVCICNRED